VDENRPNGQAPAIECPSCKAAVEVGAFLSACSEFWSNADVVQFDCPRCHSRTDARVEHSRIWLGYIYGAGGPHFSGQTEVRVPGLYVEHDGADLVVEWGDATWKIHAR
jgi:hypothetical protein